MATRLFALLAAVAMVVAALAYRGQTTGDGPLRPEGGELRLACATEVADGCRELVDGAEGVILRVEPAGTTAAAFIDATGEPPFDGWLVPQPWPAIVDEARARSGRSELFETGEVLARSPLVAVIWPDRLAAIKSSGRCKETTWRCLGEVAARSWADSGGQAAWGAVKPGHARPDVEATGLAVIGAATVGWFDRRDLSTVDLDTDDSYRAFVTGFERAVPSFPVAPLDDMLVKGAAAFDFVAVLEADAVPLLQESARSDKPEVAYPSPVITADIVLGAATGSRGQRLSRRLDAKRITETLVASGWRGPKAQPPAGTPALPGDDGLPPAGLLDALRTLWSEVRR